jgi:hypothetical protein
MNFEDVHEMATTFKMSMIHQKKIKDEMMDLSLIQGIQFNANVFTS